MFYSTLLTCSGNFLRACIPFSHSLVHLYFQVEELFSVANNGTNVETRLVNEHLYKALKGSRFHLMDITHMSEFRADAHPATAGGKKHDDCMHWCLPGITDTWNDMLVAHLLTINRSWKVTDYFHSLFTDSRSSWESVMCGCSHCWLNFVMCMPCSHLPCIKFVLFQKVVHSFMWCTLVLWKFWCTHAHTELLLHMFIYLEC